MILEAQPDVAVVCEPRIPQDQLALRAGRAGYSTLSAPETPGHGVLVALLARTGGMQKVEVPKFVPKQVNIPQTDEEMKEQQSKDIEAGVTEMSPS